MTFPCHDRDDATTYLEARRVGSEGIEWKEEIKDAKDSFDWELKPLQQ